MLASSSSGTLHGTSCGVEVDLNLPASSRTAASTSRVTSPTGLSGASATLSRPAVAVFDERLVIAQIQRDYERTRAVRRG